MGAVIHGNSGRHPANITGEAIHAKVERRDSQTNQFRGYVWKLDFGKPNHAFDTYVYNLAALEIFAEDFCKSLDSLGLDALNWDAFWEAARTGVFYEERT
ncbi:MAG: hypothetical protein LBK66_05075 [Spirochaetaceae bacterium]|jgi:phage terminase large subunit GpA-like protein|nr:hypothetical protein [Spirochaetaceae bacterium]